MEGTLLLEEEQSPVLGHLCPQLLDGTRTTAASRREHVVSVPASR